MGVWQPIKLASRNSIAERRSLAYPQDYREDQDVSTAQMILEYIKILRWPLLILAVVLGFRSWISKKLDE